MARVSPKLWAALEEAEWECRRLCADRDDPYGTTTDAEVVAAKRVRAKARKAVVDAARA